MLLLLTLSTQLTFALSTVEDNTDQNKVNSDSDIVSMEYSAIAAKMEDEGGYLPYSFTISDHNGETEIRDFKFGSGRVNDIELSSINAVSSVQALSLYWDEIHPLIGREFGFEIVSVDVTKVIGNENAGFSLVLSGQARFNWASSVTLYEENTVLGGIEDRDLLVSDLGTTFMPSIASELSAAVRYVLNETQWELEAYAADRSGEFNHTKNSFNYEKSLVGAKITFTPNRKKCSSFSVGAQIVDLEQSFSQEASEYYGTINHAADNSVKDKQFLVQYSCHRK